MGRRKFCPKGVAPEEHKVMARGVIVSFPPQPSASNRDQIELCLTVYRGAIPRSSAVYVATPITTGERFAKWYVEEGKALLLDSAEYYAARRKAVIEPNISLTRHFVDQLRLETQK